MSSVLVTDDDDSIRLLLESILKIAGHEVRVAPDGARALAFIAEREPDLLILDLSMPHMSGLEVCAAVRANPFTAHLPILMLTAQSEVSDKVAGFEAGADDYLAKPFAAQELTARVNALLRLVQRQGERNPSTGLPGGRAIQAEIDRRAALGQLFAICYFDLDNFKPFADNFGFVTADRVIRETGALLRTVAAEDNDAEGGQTHNYVGHIGGDDFIVVTSGERAESLARAAAARFPALVREAVGAEAACGTFTGMDRNGHAREFPLTQLSAVVLLIDPRQWVSTTHLGTMAAAMKRQGRSEGPGSVVVGTLGWAAE